MFELGLIVGRFQCLHSGHEYMINTGLNLCKRLCVFIGSTQEKYTIKNPFPYEIRELFLRKIYGDKIDIFPLKDINVGDNNAWGKYVLKNALDKCGRIPDLLISGKESVRSDWYGRDICELILPRTNISATQMRSFLFLDDKKSWEFYTNPRLHEYYEECKEIIRRTEGA